jgi:hypothetical protein
MPQSSPRALPELCARPSLGAQCDAEKALLLIEPGAEVMRAEECSWRSSGLVSSEGEEVPCVCVCVCV